MTGLPRAFAVGLLLLGSTALACEEDLQELQLELTRALPIFSFADGVQFCANQPQCVAKVRELRREIQTRDWPVACAGKDAYTKVEAAKFLELSADFEEEVGFFEWLFGD